MRNWITATALLILIGSPAAIAQTGGGAGSSSGTANAAASSGKDARGSAPVGHRQPRVSDIPSEKNLSDPNDPVSREDAALDRKIRGICRGC